MGATSQEEIAKQHSSAIKIIQSNKPCISRINHGEVPLSWKLKPTCTLNVDGVDDNGGESIREGKEDGEVDEGRGIEVVNVDYPTWCVSSRKFMFDVCYVSFCCNSSPFISSYLYLVLYFDRWPSGRVNNSQTNKRRC